MNLNQLALFTGNLLSTLGIRYFTFGAVAMGSWLRGRATFDLDIIVNIENKKVPILIGELNKHGFQITKSLQRKLLEGRIIQLPIGSTELDIKLARGEHDLQALERAAKVSYETVELFVATPEDIILYKLQSFRRQDQADIEKIKTEIKDLDTKYIKEWIAKLSEETGLDLQERWKSI